MKALCLCVILCALCGYCLGQSTTPPRETHSREQIWVAYFNQTRLTDKFGLWLDVHQRLTDNFAERPFQLLIRPAATWFIKDNLRLNAGYASITHFPTEGFETIRPEHRVWQQIWWNQKHTGFTLLQWLRFEQRFNRKIANDVLQDGYNKSDRLRYNLSFSIPIGKKEIAAKTPFVTVIDELFINLGKNVVYNTFDQNRFVLGMGYQFTSSFNMQLGYLNVFQQEAIGHRYVVSHGVRLFAVQNLDFR